MMRFVSILMILAGLLFAFIIPLLGQFGGEFEVTAQRVFTSEQRQAVSFDVELATLDSPLRFDITFQQTNPYPQFRDTADVPIVVNGPEGSVFTQVMTLNWFVVDGVGWGEFQTPTFSIFQDGVYTITIGPVIEEGLALETVDARLVGNVGEVLSDTSFLGFTLLGAGLFGYVFSGIGKRKKPKQDAQRGPWAKGSKTSQIGRGAPREEPKREPKKTKHKWGRGEEE